MGRLRPRKCGLRAGRQLEFVTAFGEKTRSGSVTLFLSDLLSRAQ
jgi:hypothetical protein